VPPSAPADGGANISLAQMHESYQFAIDRGLSGWTAERANAELAEQGLPPLPGPKAADPLNMDPKTAPITATAAQINAEFPIPKSIAEYRLPSILPHGTAPTTEDMTSGKALAEIMLAAELPADIGTSVANIGAEFIKANPGYDKISDTAYEMSKATCSAQLQRLWGDGYANKLKAAAEFVAAVDKKKPGTIAYLRQTGLANSPKFIAQVYNHAQRQGMRYAGATA
jgi:hypothetical protein